MEDIATATPPPVLLPACGVTTLSVSMGSSTVLRLALEPMLLPPVLTVAKTAAGWVKCPLVPADVKIWGGVAVTVSEVELVVLATTAWAAAAFFLLSAAASFFSFCSCL